MKKNNIKKQGQKFEKEFIASMPDDRRVFRIPEATANHGGSSGFKFAHSVLCDYIVKSSKYLRCLEMKSTKTKSVAIPRQHERLMSNDGPGVVSVYVMNFRTYGMTYAILVNDADKVFTNKKSINILDCEKYGVRIDEAIVPPNRTRTTYRIKQAFLSLESLFNGKTKNELSFGAKE